MAMLALVQTPQLAQAHARSAAKADTAARARPDAARREAAAREREKPDTARPVRPGGPLFAVVIGPGPAWKKGQPLRKSRSDDHWRYWQDLHDKGLVESAGPVGKDTGFVLLRARNQREANALIAADPAVRAGRFRGVARPYDQTIGD
jgi:uncharacterized protein YciI